MRLGCERLPNLCNVTRSVQGAMKETALTAQQYRRPQMLARFGTIDEIRAIAVNKNLVALAAHDGVVEVAALDRSPRLGGAAEFNLHSTPPEIVKAAVARSAAETAGKLEFQRHSSPQNVLTQTHSASIGRRGNCLQRLCKRNSFLYALDSRSRQNTLCRETDSLPSGLPLQSESTRHILLYMPRRCPCNVPPACS